MNFGQHWRGQNVSPFEGTVQLPVEFVVEQSAGFLKEFEDDAKSHPDPEDELEEWLRRAGWPGAEQVVEDAEAFPRLVDYIGFEILVAWFGDVVPSADPGYVINTIESASVQGDQVIVRCTGRLAGTSLAYQD